MTIQALITEARENLQKIEAERNRLIDEGRDLGFIAVGAALVISPFIDFGFRTRADATLSLIDALERYARDVFPRLEQRAIDGDAHAAENLVTSSENILRAARGATPRSDLIVDADRFVKETTSQLKIVSLGIGAALAAAAVGYFVLK